MELSNVAFDDLRVGERNGPYEVEVTAELAERLAGEIGVRSPVAAVPPAVYPVVFLVALRHAMGGIPAGSMLSRSAIRRKSNKVYSFKKRMGIGKNA